MSLWTQKAEDAFNRGLGYSQEYLDAIRNGAAELRAKREARGPLPVFEPYSSDSELDLEHDNLPLTPPQSPKRDGLDLSRKAWQRSTWGDLSRGMDPSDIIGWGAFEVWQSHMVSKHAPELSASTSLPKSKPNPPGKRARPAIPVSERLTRSKSTVLSLFYELSHDGKTGLPIPSAVPNSRSNRSRKPQRTLSMHRVRKR